MLAYIGRAEAVALARAADPGVTILDEHIFQGDIFEKHLELMSPVPGGTVERVLAEAVVVVSHSCEFTKAAGRRAPSDYPILVAPARSLGAFPSGQHQQFRDGKVVFAPYLPVEDPINEELIVDLKLTQPIAAADLMEASLACCMHPDQRRLFQNRIALFFLRERILT